MPCNSDVSSSLFPFQRCFLLTTLLLSGNPHLFSRKLCYLLGNADSFKKKKAWIPWHAEHLYLPLQSVAPKEVIYTTPMLVAFSSFCSPTIVAFLRDSRERSLQRMEIDLNPCLKPRDHIEFNLAFQLFFFFLIFLSFSFDWMFLMCRTGKGSCLHNADIFPSCIHISSWNRSLAAAHAN